MPLSKVEALHFEKLLFLDPVVAIWATISADRVACHALRLLKNSSILEFLTPATVLAECEGTLADVMRRDMHDSAFLDL